jgi:hypothetical protein
MGSLHSTNVEEGNTYMILVGKPEEKPLERPDVGGWILLI